MFTLKAYPRAPNAAQLVLELQINSNVGHPSAVLIVKESGLFLINIWGPGCHRKSNVNQAKKYW